MRVFLIAAVLLFSASQGHAITVISAESAGPAFDTILVTFDEPYDVLTGEDPFNYSIPFPDFHAAISVVGIDATSVLLNLNSALEHPVTNHVLGVFGVRSADFQSEINDQAFGITIASPAAVPEPATAAFALLAGAGLLSRRRRAA